MGESVYTVAYKMAPQKRAAEFVQASRAWKHAKKLKEQEVITDDDLVEVFKYSQRVRDRMMEPEIQNAALRPLYELIQQLAGSVNEIKIAVNEIKNTVNHIEQSTQHLPRLLSISYAENGSASASHHLICFPVTLTQEIEGRVQHVALPDNLPTTLGELQVMEGQMCNDIAPCYGIVFPQGCLVREKRKLIAFTIGIKS